MFFCEPLQVALAVVLVVSAVVAVWQAWTSRRATTLPIAVDMLELWREPEARRWRRECTEELLRRHPPGGTGPQPYDELPEDVVRLSIFFDHVGLLVAEGYVPEKVIHAHMGATVSRCWRILQPYVAIERCHRDEGAYQEFFEYLAQRYRKHCGEDLRGFGGWLRRDYRGQRVLRWLQRQPSRHTSLARKSPTG